MLDESSSRVISLLSPVQQEVDTLDLYKQETHNNSESLNTGESTPELAGNLSILGRSSMWKSCAQRSLETVLNMDLESFLKRYFTDEERELFCRIKSVTEKVPGATRVLGVLLTRQWPKWQNMPDDGSDHDCAVDALRAVGALHTLESMTDWNNIETVYPRLWREEVLLKGLGLSKKQSRLDTLLKSLQPGLLKSLSRKSSSNQSASRTMLIKEVKASYDGTQMKIFGGRNDVSSLVKRISALQDGPSKLLYLDGSCRDLFLRLSFALDIDSDDETAWTSALPQTLLKSFANIGATLLTPRRLSERSRVNYLNELAIYESADQIESTRTLSFLETLVEASKACAKTVASNVREFLESIPSYWDREKYPEWWWRRQLPRRCSNIMWKCIAELERVKYYELAFHHLSYLVDHNETLLGRKRRGKVAIRLLIEMGHLKMPFENVKEKLLNLDVFPAEKSEIFRRFGGLSINKFEWDCGPIDSRTVTIPGANSRDINWVEQAALDEFYLVPSLGGYLAGVHCEGRVMNEIFGIIFKDFLEYRKDESVWQSPLQKWALDIGFIDPKESCERWNEAEKILKEIKSRNFFQLFEFFDPSSFTSSKYDIPSILSCLTGPVLEGVMRLLLTDPYYWGGGQPDLLAWNVEKRKIVFAEVKGPGDHLSPRQRWWLAELKRLGAEAEVCHVVDEKGTNRSLGKKIRKNLTVQDVPDVIELD